MRLYGLIGFPLSHSFSKKYFTDKFTKEKLDDCSFENFEVEAISNLPEIIRLNPNLKGLCVTIPHKQGVVKYLDECDETVKETGACNSIKITGQKLYGYNTDVTGFIATVKKLLLPTDKKALILGTGGSSKAVAYGLKRLNIDYTFVSRQPHEGLITYKELTSKVIEAYSLIINCTPVGMYPNINDRPDLNYDAINNSHYLFDLTYNPSVTAFLSKGIEKGARVLNGYDMLVAQAEASWEIWNKQP